MITIADLVERGSIIPIEVNLGAREQPMRLLYGTPGFVAWLSMRLNSAEASPLLADVTPAEQLDDLFFKFLSGRPLAFMTQFRPVRSEQNAVWELKTPDLRIFGWFAMKDCFVAVFGDWADRVKDLDLYRGYRTEIKRIRRQMGAMDALCVRGIEASEVISI
jgi:hypothetical protein